MKTPDPLHDEILTVEEVAELLHLNPQTIYLRVADKTLPGFFRVGEDANSPIRFSKRVIMEWIQKEASRP